MSNTPNPQQKRKSNDNIVREALLLGESIETLQKMINGGSEAPSDLFDLAAEMGRLDVIQLAREPGFEALKPDGFTFATAASKGHLHIIVWLFEQGYMWDDDTLTHAAVYGQLKVVEYALNNGCPRSPNHPTRPFAAAARAGDIKILEMLQKAKFPWDASACAFAAKGGHQPALEWLRSQGCPWDSSTIKYATRNGHLELLKWARENGCPELSEK